MHANLRFWECQLCGIFHEIKFSKPCRVLNGHDVSEKEKNDWNENCLVTNHCNRYRNDQLAEIDSCYKEKKTICLLVLSGNRTYGSVIFCTSQSSSFAKFVLSNNLYQSKRIEFLLVINVCVRKGFSVLNFDSHEQFAACSFVPEDLTDVIPQKFSFF